MPRIATGTVSFDLNFIPTNATQSHTSGLLRDFENRTKRNFKLVLPDSGSTTWAITAYDIEAVCPHHPTRRNTKCPE
jgi:hypothetical protein